jgi:nitrate/nitrite transport system ATP-binding protein
VVFQSPSLLPWLTAFENVMLGVDQVFYTASAGERRQIAEYYLTVVGLGDALHKRPAELSARACANGSASPAPSPSRPRCSCSTSRSACWTRSPAWNSSRCCVDLWTRNHLTALMVTHDVDEALFLADRIVMMTNGPEAEIRRRQLLEDPAYYELREQLIGFLEERSHLRPLPPPRPAYTPPSSPKPPRTGLNRLFNAFTTAA